MNLKELEALRLKKINEKILKDHLSCAEHKFPVSRREFLASGLITLGTYSTLPTAMSLFSRAAHAQGVGCDEAQVEWPVYINLHLGGGPALYANHLISSEAGRSFNDFGGYKKLGLGPNPSSELLFKNKAPFWSEIKGQSKGSPMLKGFKNVLASDTQLWNNENSGAIQANTVFVAASAKSVDDTRATNREEHDLTGILQNLGVAGPVLPYLFVGVGNYVNSGNITHTGFKSLLAADPQYLKVIDSNSITNALTPNIDQRILNQPKLTQHLYEAIMNLTKAQLSKITKATDPINSKSTFNRLMSCAVEKNNKIINSNESNTELLDEEIWGNDKTTDLYRVGLAVSQSIKGLSASTSIHLGGYDYHLNQVSTREQADKKDEYAGEVIARILKSAHKHNKKVFLYVSADGSVNSPQTGNLTEDVAWRSDYGLRGVNYIFAYDPTGNVTATPYESKFKMVDESWQLNHFLVDEDNLYRVNTQSTLHDIKVSGAAVLLNYLSFAGRYDQEINNPKLSELFRFLETAVPSEAKSFKDYFLRIRG